MHLKCIVGELIAAELAKGTGWAESKYMSWMGIWAPNLRIDSPRPL